MIEFPSPNRFPSDIVTVRNAPDPALSHLLIALDNAISFGRQNPLFEQALMQRLTRIYGQHAATIREAWAEFSNPELNPSDPILVQRSRIRANLLAIADLETVSPGSARRLFEADGIRNPGRYSRFDLLTQDHTNVQIAKGEKPRRKKTALFLVAANDWSNSYAVLKTLNMSPRSRQSLADNAFGIHIIEAASPQEGDQRVTAYRDRFGEQEQAFLIIHAHGTRTSLIQSHRKDGVFRVEHFGEGRVGRHMIEALAKQVVIINFSCESMAPVPSGENIAYAIYQASNVITVAGTTKVAAPGSLLFDTLEDVLRFGVIFFERNDEKPRHPYTESFGRRYHKDPQ